MRKGLNRLIEFANKIEMIEGFNMLIAAPDNHNTELFRHLKKTKILIGLKREDMNAFYNCGDIMYFPSLYEGFEMVTAECLSAGVPVIGNDIGAVGDLYRIHQEGIALLQDDMNQDIAIIKSLANQYREYSSKMCLHQSMIEKCSLKEYSVKLRRVLKS